MAFNNHLSQTHVKVLDKHGVDLIKCSDINDIFLAHLRQNDVLQEEDVNELQEMTPTKRASFLVKKMRKRPSDSFLDLIKVFADTGQNHISDMLWKTLAEQDGGSPCLSKDANERIDRLLHSLIPNRKLSLEDHQKLKAEIVPRQEFHKLSFKYNELNRSFNRLMEHFDNARERVETLRNINIKKESTEQELKKKLEEHEKCIEKLQQERKAAIESEKRLVNELAQREQDLERVRAINESDRVKLENEMEKQNKDFKIKLVRLEESNTCLRETIDQQKRELVDLQMTLSDISKKRNKSTLKPDESESSNLDHSTSKLVCEHDVVSEDAYSYLEVSIKKLSEDIAGLEQSENSAKVSQLKNQCLALRNQVEKFRQKAVSLTTQNDELKTALTKLQLGMADKENQIRELQRKIEELNDKFNESDGSIYISCTESMKSFETRSSIYSLAEGDIPVVSDLGKSSPQNGSKGTGHKRINVETNDSKAMIPKRKQTNEKSVPKIVISKTSTVSKEIMKWRDNVTRYPLKSQEPTGRFKRSATCMDFNRTSSNESLSAPMNYVGMGQYSKRPVQAQSYQAPIESICRVLPHNQQKSGPFYGSAQPMNVTVNNNVIFNISNSNDNTCQRRTLLYPQSQLKVGQFPPIQGKRLK